MSLKTSILRSYVGALVCALLPFSRVTARGDVPRAQNRRLLSNDRFDAYLRQVAVKLATLCLLACASLTSAETLVVDESNHRGWSFFANPAVTVAGEAPIVGIGDHAGGAASLNFSLNASQDKSSRNARLLKSDFPAAGLTDITTLRDLSSISWQVHHSDPGNYPKFVVWVEVPITDDGVSEPEAIYFRPQNQAVTLSEWDLVEVDLVNSKFTNNGVTTDGKKSTGTFADWLEIIGGYDIYEIGIQYNNGNNSYVSYIDYIEINGTTFDFEASPPLPPSAPTDLVATPGDGQLDIAFTPADDNGTDITDYQYQTDGGSWISAGTTGSPITISDGLTNGTDYAIRLRAISAAGNGEEAQILAAPRGIADAVTLLVTSDNPRGFRLAEYTSDYVQERDNVGRDDGFGGASIDASLEGQGADRWGLFLDPKQFKGDQISQAGRKADRLQDLTSLSYRVWHNGEGYYPMLGFRMEREAPSDDGKTIAQLNLKMNQMPSLTPGWNTVEIKFAQSPFTISYLSETSETSETKTLSEWIVQYGDRRINLFRWQTGDGRADRNTTQETYVDYIEVNGVTYDFEGTLPEVPDECSSADWAAVEVSDASKQTFRCVADEAVYEYADFHVLTTTGNVADICQSSLPINVNNQDNDALFCSESEGVVRAIFDWDNRSIEPGARGIRLTWLNTVSQIGSRKKGSTPCGGAGETVAGRCANQLAHGQRAFVDMAGAGGPAIAALDTSNLQSFGVMFAKASQFNENISGWDTSAITDMQYLFQEAKAFNQDIGNWNTGAVKNMREMFKGASAFNQDLPWNTSAVKNMKEMFWGAAAFNQNIGGWDTSSATDMASMFKEAKVFDQDLSGWNVTKVTDYSDFDTTTDVWCGLGFDNRGRPSDWVPTDTVGCLNVVLQAPLSSSVGDEFDYVVQYYNQSERDLINGALTLVVPAGMTISDAGNGNINGSQVTWAGVDVLAGSSADGAGGERRVGVTVDAGTADGAALEASATLSDGAATTVNDIARTVISAKPVLITQISASQQVAPGEVIQYALSVSNEGQSTATGGQVTLSWEGDAPFTIQDSGSAICATATSCSWSGDLSSQDTRSQTVQVRVGTTAISGQTLRASVSASASNDVADEGNTASVTTEISALPLPALSVGLTTQPQGVLTVGEQFVAFFDMTNTGKGAAESITATLEIPNDVTYVGGVAGGGQGVYDDTTNSVTWTLSSLAPSGSANFGVTLKAPEVFGGIILKADAATQKDGQQITASGEIALHVTGDAVLDLQLSLDPSEQVLPGDALEMALQFQNIGSDTAFAAVVDTETPADTTLLAWPDYAQCTTGGAGGECTVGYAGEMRLPLGDVEAKENAVAIIQVLVSEVTQAAQISAGATLTGTDRDGEALAQQAASESVSVAAVNEIVLTVSQQADRQTAAPGQVVVYEISYQNGGNSDVSNAVLAGVLPADTRLLNLSGNTPTDDSDGGTTTWRLPLDTLAPFDSGTVRLEVEVAGNAEPGTSLNNQVTLSAADDTERAEAALVKVVPGGAAVLESSIGNPEATVPGGSFNYALYYANTGTLAAANTPLQMQVEKGLTVTECDGCATQTENDAGVLLSWSLGSVEMGSGTKQISVTVDPGVAANSELHAISYIGEPQNGSRATGTVSGKLDAQSARRRAGEAGLREAPSSVELEGPLGLSVITVGKQDSPALGDLTIAAPDRAVAGDQVAVAVSFANTGGAAATNVTLSATVPTHSAVDSVEGGVCSATPCLAGDTITWTIGDVSAGSTRTVSYVLTIDSSAVGEVIQHRVALDSTESLEESAFAQTAVLDAILSVAIGVADAGGANAEASYVSAGDTLTYTLTLLNDSPVAQSNLTVVNQLPPLIAACGAACVSGDASGAAVNAKAGTLTWSGINLDADSDVSLDYQVVIPADMADNTTLVNSVSVSKSARLSGSDSATVTVSSKAALSVSMTAPAVLQDGAQGSLTLTARNTGTVGTATTLRYVLPSNATMVDNAGASVSGAAYTWSLDNLAPDVSDSRVITIAAVGTADTTLLHTATVTGAGTSDSTEARTVIGVREELALSLTAPASADTDTGFTASLSARNTGNAAANGTIVTLTLPTGFTATDLAGGTLDSQVIRWTLNLAANATQTLSPTIMAPTAPDTGVLLGGLTAISGKTQSASATVRVTAPAAAIIQASAQFSVVEAMAGETVSLSAGPTNIGDAAAGVITNIVTVASGLAPLETSGATWSSTDRTLRWTTSSLAAQASDLKQLTLQVEEAGPLSADVSSGGANSTATMVRASLEKVSMQPIARESQCQLSGRPVVQAAPTPPDGMTLAFANAVGFSVVDCGRGPNADYPERMRITIDMGRPIPADAQLYKIADSGAWSVIAAADIEGQTVTYTLSDDGELDQDKTPGILRDPVALAFPTSDEGEGSPVVPVPLPWWLLAVLSVLIGGLGYRRLHIA